MNKKVDYAMGLLLPRSDQRALARAPYVCQHSVPSINQTDTFANFVPMFLNIEVKRHVSDVDPMVQLGVWVAAEFRKRSIEAYDRNMPVLAIAITGDKWDLWIAYDAKYETSHVDEVVCS